MCNAAALYKQYGMNTEKACFVEWEGSESIDAAACEISSIRVRDVFSAAMLQLLMVESWSCDAYSKISSIALFRD
jgi:hypothetical protein